MPNQKEINYYSDDIPLRFQPQTRADYLRLFRDAPEGALCGEVSSTYLYSDVAIPQIRSDNPNAKVIVLLRNPRNAVSSLHLHQLYNFEDDVADLRTAWALQSRRRSGLNLPPHCHAPKLLLYRDVYSYPKQIARLYQFVPSDRRYIIIFEEFRQDPLGTCHALVRFLGLLPSDLGVLHASNASRTFRNQTMGKFFRYPPVPFNYLRSPLKRLANALGWQPLRWFERIAAKPTSCPAMDPEFEDELNAMFESEIVELEELLGRDLEVWRREVATEAADAS